MSRQGTLIQLTDDDLVWLRTPTSGALVPGEPTQAGERLAALLASDDPGTYALEGALPGVHYLLVGDGVGLLGFLLDAGLGDVIMSPVAHVRSHLLAAPTVAAIADAIESMSARDVRLRLESDTLRALGPFAQRPLDDEDKEWLLAVLQGLMTFMRRAAKDRVSVLVALH